METSGICMFSSIMEIQQDPGYSTSQKDLSSFVITLMWQTCSEVLLH